MLRSLFRSLRATQKAPPAKAAAVADEEVIGFLTAGAAEQKAGRLSQAEFLYRKALEHDPRNHGAMYLMGTLCLNRRDFDQSEWWLRSALELLPDSAHVLNTLGSVLMSTARHQEARECLEAAVRADPGAIRPFANLLFLTNLLPGMSREESFAKHRRWGELHGKQAMVQQGDGWSEFSASSTASGRLRVGYVSADFYEHPVGRIISGILKEHDRSRLQIHCYDSGSEDDHVYQACRTSAEIWHDVAALPDEQLADKISRDGIHVLVDLSGHTRNGRLGVFARKPAPVQITWLGYLNTTGLPEMDWRLTEKVADPLPDAPGWHTERLLYLPHCLWPCAPLRSGSNSPLPFESSGIVTYGSFNTFRKINPAVLDVWAKVLAAVPDSRLRLFGVPIGRAVEWLHDEFERRGVDLSRLSIMTTMAYDRYLQAYSEVDISLDTFPYSGGATTWESLWMGVPVVSMRGKGGFSSTSASLLVAAGCGNWIADSAEEFVRIAASLAESPSKLRITRQNLRGILASSRLVDIKGFTRNLERAYQLAWEMRADRKALEPVEISPC